MLLQTHSTDIYPFEIPENLVSEIAELQAKLECESSSDQDLVLSMEQLLLHVWQHRWPQSSNTHVTTDPTMLFLAFRMLLPQGNFREARPTTPVISRITYCMRLVAVLELGLGNELKGHDVDHDKEWKRLAPFFTEKVDSTFNSLRSLQHFATAKAQAEICLPRVVWTDRRSYREMLYLGDPITFDGLQKVFGHLETQLIAIWEKDLLLNTKLTIDWYPGLVADNLTDHSPEYSAFSDPRNTFFADKKGALLSAVLETPHLLQQFTTGIDISTGNPTWNYSKLRQYLAAYSKFHSLLLLRWMMLGGSPMRGTEAVSFLLQNTTTRTRNLVFLASHLAVLTMYHKAGANSGVDKLLPHAGDAITTDLTIQDVVLVRPFAQLAAFLCYPKDSDVHTAYRDLMFVNRGRAFMSDEISDTMGKITEKIIGVRLTINPFRHISIAFRRMLVDRVSEATAQQELTRQIEAEQAGHSDRVEQSIYAVSLDALRGQSDQMIGAFCDASCRWQVKCAVVPSGVHKPFTETRSHLFLELQQSGAFDGDTTDSNGIANQVEEMLSRAMDKLKPFIRASIQDALDDHSTHSRISTTAARDRSGSEASLMSDIQPTVTVSPRKRIVSYSSSSSNTTNDRPTKRACMQSLGKFSHTHSGFVLTTIYTL